MIDGTAYGVILNDSEELARIAPEFAAAPYQAPPRAPVLYIKPRNTLAATPAAVELPDGVAHVTAAATLALVFDGSAAPVAARLALDLSEPHSSYFRPAVRERCRDRFLPLADLASLPVGHETVVTRINGREVHRWSLERLARPLDVLVRDVAEFMTLAAGDLLLVGLPGNAPRAKAGDRIDVSCEGYPPLECTLFAEEVA